MKCLNCGKDLINKQKKYCSNQCQREFQFNQKILEWKNGEFNGMSGEYGLSNYIRIYMLKKANFSCERCGWNQINPITQTCPLDIHHKDGDFKNNKEENLEVLCPNCHSLTENYKSLNTSQRDRTNYTNRKAEKVCIECGIKISNSSTRCKQCENKSRITDKPISREELKILIRQESFIKIGEQFGVSDNTIRKWCVGYNLPSKKTLIKQYNDEQWENI